MANVLEGDKAPDRKGRGMLILAVADGERIMIGDSIVVQLVGFGHCPKGQTARLGITAPREIPVDREAVRAKILQEGRRPRGAAED